MSGDYFFRYLFPPGSAADDFPTSVHDLLTAAGVPYELRRRDWSSFIAFRVIVPAAVESKAAFRLLPFTGFLRSQGPTSIGHVSVRPSYWLHERRREARSPARRT